MLKKNFDAWISTDIYFNKSSKLNAIYFYFEIFEQKFIKKDLEMGDIS